MQIQLVPVARIRRSPNQPRESIDAERLGALADDIAAQTLLQPIGVRGPDPDGNYELAWGERRWLAHQLLQRAEIEARIFPWDFDPMLATASENLNREQLTPLEEARLVKMYHDGGHPLAGIARLLRHSVQWITERLALLELPVDLQEAIRDYRLPLVVARLLKDVDHEAYRHQLIYEALEHGCTEATAQAWRAHYLNDRARILHNNLQVEQIIQERGKYVVRYPCDWCEEPTEYQHTRTLRLCLRCFNEATTAKGGAPEDQR